MCVRGSIIICKLLFVSTFVFDTQRLSSSTSQNAEPRRKSRQRDVMLQEIRETDTWTRERCTARQKINFVFFVDVKLWSSSSLPAAPAAGCHGVFPLSFVYQKYNSAFSHHCKHGLPPPLTWGGGRVPIICRVVRNLHSPARLYASSINLHVSQSAQLNC